ncbi:trypsin-like serine protease [Kordia algicida OT-1]|uniref:Peptidase S1 domain-containing protein n=1 Tax=Kordia algicida OT-1 TaxID=391587 RepID=A9ECG8_9FLAO|nr:trypsin-like serine protease [Kordia algicida]EDP94362.1 hypothetical protein KAOT1_09946 [Kordia algicida OT-1]
MTEDLANIQLEQYGDFFIEMPGVHYVAVVKDDNNVANDYSMEIGVDKKFEKDVNLILKQRKSILEKIPFELKLPIKRKKSRFLRKDINSFKGINFVRSLPFYFQNEIASGQEISMTNASQAKGTIGAIVELENHKGDFILSNWHVMMQSSGDLGAGIDNKSDEKIAELFWGLNNEYYDIALSKIISKKQIIKERKIDTVKKYKDIRIGDSVKIEGFKSGFDKNTIYSKNAYVKVGNEERIFKNQIMTGKLSVSGDSGSIVLNKKNEIIGIVCAGDNKKFSICNHLHSLLSSNILPKYEYGDKGKKKIIKMPEIKFKAIYTNKSLIIRS